MLLHRGPSDLFLFQFALCVPLVSKYQLRLKQHVGFEMFAVYLVTQKTYVYTSSVSRYCACGGTLFEQDWQSLICPDGAHSEVRGLYILNLN